MKRLCVICNQWYFVPLADVGETHRVCGNCSADMAAPLELIITGFEPGTLIVAPDGSLFERA